MTNSVGAYLNRAFSLSHAAHAYIVVGEKAQLPSLLKRCAAVCMCKNHSADGDACENCRKVQNGAHQDVLWFPHEEGRTRLNVADMQILVEETYKRPVDNSDCRVFLINAADSVSGVGSDIWQNKLLKTLEEPNPDTYIFVGVCDAESLLATVRSRCQTLKPPKQTVAEITAALVQRGYERALAEVAAAVSGGNLDTAEAIFAGPSVLDAFQNASNMLQNMTSTKNSLLFVAPVLADKQNITWFLRFLTLLLGESIHFRLAENLCVLPSHAKVTEKICQNYTLPAAEACIEKVAEAQRRLDGGGNVTVVTDELFVTISEVKYRCRL